MPAGYEHHLGQRIETGQSSDAIPPQARPLETCPTESQKGLDLQIVANEPFNPSRALVVKELNAAHIGVVEVGT